MQTAVWFDSLASALHALKLHPSSAPGIVWETAPDDARDFAYVAMHVTPDYDPYDVGTERAFKLLCGKMLPHASFDITMSGQWNGEDAKRCQRCADAAALTPLRYPATAWGEDDLWLPASQWRLARGEVVEFTRVRLAQQLHAQAPDFAQLNHDAFSATLRAFAAGCWRLAQTRGPAWLSSVNPALSGGSAMMADVTEEVFADVLYAVVYDHADDPVTMLTACLSNPDSV